MTKKLLPILLLAGPALAQTTIKDALIKHWKVSGDFTIGVAKAMPAESYNFRPSPEEMSFGQLIAHLAGADLMACSYASGQKPPTMPAKIMALRSDPKTEIDRDLAVNFATDAFAFCNQAIASMTPEQLDKTVGTATRQMTAFEWLWSYFTHTAHHRGQAEVYLRVKGIKPPDYQF
jgi:uncharacterized damage-inducible protein DinB